MSKFEAILFDLDGTLADTAPDFYTTLHELCDRYSLPRINESIIRDNVSDGSRALTRLCFPGLSDGNSFEAKRLELLEIYAACVGTHTRLFPEMQEIIQHLNQNSIAWGIVTNKPRRYTELLLNRKDLAPHCASLICADDLTRAKPDPEGILKACSQLSVNPENCLYVGDHERDIIAGKAASCKTACVSFGYFNADTKYEAWGADYTIHTASDFISQTS